MKPDFVRVPLSKLAWILAAAFCGLVPAAAHLGYAPAFVCVLVVGAVALLALPVTWAAACLPVWHAGQSTWPRQLAAALPMLSWVVFFFGILFPSFQRILPGWITSNLGPPILCGFWAWYSLGYFAILRAFFPTDSPS